MTPKAKIQRITLTIVLLFSTSIVNAETSKVFTHSVVEVKGNRNTVLAKIQSDVVPKMTKVGGTLYAIWTPPRKSPDPSHPVLVAWAKKLKGPVKIPKMNSDQLIVMFAWPKDAVKSKELYKAIDALAGIEKVTTRTLEPLYLMNGLSIPTGRGYYVHRESRYRRKDVPKVLQLTKEAARMWEPYWVVQVTGLFRLQGNAEQAQLMKLSWYPTPERWSESRYAIKEPESQKRFKECHELELTWDAIGTDRVVSDEEVQATEALALVTEHVHLFHKTDAKAISLRTMGVPLVWSKSNGAWRTISTAEDVEDFFTKIFVKIKVKKHWVRSVTNYMKAYSLKDGRVMVDYSFTRQRADGSPIESFATIYIVSKKDIGWRITAKIGHDLDRVLSIRKSPMKPTKRPSRK